MILWPAWLNYFATRVSFRDLLQHILLAAPVASRIVLFSALKVFLKMLNAYSCNPSYLPSAGILALIAWQQL